MSVNCQATESAAWPRISIISAVFNAASTIEVMLQSVLDQEYPDLELIVIDGGSTDGTVEVLERYSDRLTYWLSESDNGQTCALNKGFAKATGDALAWINADEAYTTNTLQLVGEVFAADPQLDFFYGQRIVVDEMWQEIGRRHWCALHPRDQLLYRGIPIPTDTSFWSRRVHDLTGQLNAAAYPHMGMDNDWFLRMSHHVERWRVTRNYLSRFMERPDRKTVPGAEGLEGMERSMQRRALREYSVGPVRLGIGFILAGLWARWYERRLLSVFDWQSFMAYWRQSFSDLSGKKASHGD